MSLARRVVLVGVFGCALAALAWLGGAERVRSSEDGSRASVAAASKGSSAVRLESATDQRERTSSEPVVSASSSAELLDDDALRRLLEQIERAYTSESFQELEQLLSGLLADPAQLREVAQRLVTDGAGLGDRAARGAIVALEAGIALYERDTARFGSAGSETMVFLIDALPTLTEEYQAAIVRLLKRVLGPGGRALDGRFLAKLLELRANHPDHASVLVALLATVAEGLSTSDHRESFRRLFLDGEDDPLLVKSALSSLIAESPDTYLWIARELHARDPANTELRGAITQAIASAAPLGDAVRLLSTITDGTDYSAFMTLASRSGAEEEVVRAYDALLTDGANPEARKLLVSSMARESDEVLLGIARMDPEPVVALQALLSLTVRGPVAPERLAELRAYFSEGDRHPSGARMVAENVMVVSSGDARDQAREWLVEMVRDSSLSDAARLDAYGRVRRWVPAGTFAGLVIGGQPLQ